ncbi:TIGR01777 family oxidoreductase [Brevibacterium yomogidense]|uniref:TIGR01777 family oxidoreductase n=1 Tax=Brevibacterium yomogidense TaxID=946573 RepID=UPI0018DF99A2|nr:TIGR01777 family oxidoreductase [Brevibacterium yomogidense]
MTSQTVVLAGASGFIGTHLVRRFVQDGYRVLTIGRGSGADAGWGGDLGGVLAGADALINLAGRSVSCRYTKRTADEIFRSRTETTRALGRALAECSDPPVWLNASTGTIYRDARDRPQDEETGELGTGFSVAVARAWENELWDAPVDVRKVALRMSIVLGAGGALNPNINLARLGLGGRQGDGAQIMSWIHVEDVYRAVRHVLARDTLTGPINLATPQPVTNDTFMREVRAHLGGGVGTRIGVPLPAWSLEAGARIIRTEAELVLKSRWVEPRKLLDSGFAYLHPSIGRTLSQISERTRAGLVPVQLG